MTVFMYTVFESCDVDYVFCYSASWKEVYKFRSQRGRWDSPGGECSGHVKCLQSSLLLAARPGKCGHASSNHGGFPSHPGGVPCVWMVLVTCSDSMVSDVRGVSASEVT
ncbi:hypothetical protein FKM82_024180 [Ascaphus truei]